MNPDIVLQDTAIELVDAKVVRIQNKTGTVLVTIQGRLNASKSVQTNEIKANSVTLGSNAAGEPKKNGMLVIKSANAATPNLTMRNGALSAKQASVTTVAANDIKTAKVVVGRGGPSEPKPAGVVEVRTNKGAVAVKLDGSGDITLRGLGSLRRLLGTIERRLARLERR